MSFDWQACFSPVYNKGYKQLPENYMPVFLTCTCSKIMEHIFFFKYFSPPWESSYTYNDFKHCCRQFQSSEIKLTGFEFINVAKDLQNMYDRRTWCVCHRFLKSRDNCAAWRTCVYHIKNISWILFYAVKKILRAIHKGITSFFFISFQFCRRLLVSEWPSNKKLFCASDLLSL